MKIKHLFRSPDDGGDGGVQAAAPVAAPAAPVAAPAPVAASPAAAPVASPAAAPATAGAWREDWRETLAKGDQQKLTRFQRYASPEAVAEALVHAQDRIAKGLAKPGKDATPEAMAEWRAANGIPESPDKYNLDLKVSESGKAVLDKFLPIAHATNQTPDQIKASMQFISDMTREAHAQRQEADLSLENQSQEMLREEWGPEYKRNMNVIQNLLDGVATPEVKEKLFGGRLADGTPIGSSPEMLRLLLAVALVQNPAATVVPGSAGNPMKGIEEEIAGIEKTMRSDRRRYNSDTKMQARYRELLEVQERLKARG